MPYLRVDLDGKKKWPLVAKGLGLDVAHVSHGLLELWEMCWRERMDAVSILQLECLFGAAGERVGAVLEAFGFAESMEDGRFRVRGTEEYLRVSEAASEKGKARTKNAKRDAKGRLLPSQHPAAAGEPSSRAPAADLSLHPITQSPIHPSLKRRIFEGGELPKAKVEKPARPKADWDFCDFQQWCQYVRQAQGYPPEDSLPLGELEKWWRVAMEWSGMDVQPLCDGFLVFGKSEYWEERGFPFRAFVSKWKDFCRKERANVAV